MEHDHDHDHDDMEGMEGMEEFDDEPMEGEPMAQTFFFGMDTAQGFVTYVTPPENCTLKLTSVALPKKIAAGTMVRIFAKSVPLEEGEEDEEEGEDKKEEEGEDKADEEDDLKNAFCICVLKAGHEEFRQIDLTLSSGEKLKMIVEADTEGEDKKEEITIHIAGYYTLENYPQFEDEDEDDEIPLGEVEDDNSEEVSDDEQALYKKLAQGEDMAEEDEEDQSFVFQEQKDAEEDAEAVKALVSEEEPVQAKKSKKEKKQEKKQGKKEEKKEEPKKEEKKPEAAKPAEKKSKAEKKAEKRKRDDEAAPAAAEPAEKKQKQEDGQGKKKKNKKNKKNKKQAPQ